jgi:hypothetical protein
MRLGDVLQPALQPIGLSRLAAPADQLEAPSDLADRDDRHVQRRVLALSVSEERAHAGVGLCLLA